MEDPSEKEPNQELQDSETGGLGSIILYFTLEKLSCRWKTGGIRKEKKEKKKKEGKKRKRNQLVQGYTLVEHTNNHGIQETTVGRL